MLPPPTASQPDSQAWGTAVNGLQIALRLDETNSPQCDLPRFILTFRNVGKESVRFYLGDYNGTPANAHPHTVVLFLTDAQNRSRRLELHMTAELAGTLPVPEIELLQPGSTDSIRLDLTKYDEPGRIPWKSEPGAYSLTAQFEGKDAPAAPPEDGPLPPFESLPFWKGTIISNEVRFNITSR